QALERHRLSDAREHIRLCLIVWPNSDEAHFLAGRAARRALDFKHAEKHFREYQRLLGKTPGLMLEETLIQVQQGQVDKFEGFLRREVDKGNPDSPLIFEALVEGYMRLHRLLEASTCLAVWEKLQPDNMYLYFLRGSIRERIPNFEAAMDDYRK